MKIITLAALGLCAVITANPVWANNSVGTSAGTNNNYGNNDNYHGNNGNRRPNPDNYQPNSQYPGNGSGINVDVNPGNLNTNSNSQSCVRCCVYQNDNYSEGAIIKIEGETLQCARDPRALSTNRLQWMSLKR